MKYPLFATTLIACALAVGPAMAQQQQSQRSNNNNQQNRGESVPFELQQQQVMQIQQKLSQDGFLKAKPDGKWGDETADALKKFQKKQNLPETGKLDEQTMQELGVSLNSTTGSAQGSGSSSQLQNQQQQKGSQQQH